MKAFYTKLNCRYKMLSEVPTMVWSTDSHGNFEYTNSKWIEFTDLDAAANAENFAFDNSKVLIKLKTS